MERTLLSQLARPTPPQEDLLQEAFEDQISACLGVPNRDVYVTADIDGARCRAGRLAVLVARKWGATTGRGTGVNESDLRKRIGEVRRRLVIDGPPWTRALDGDFDRVAVPQRDCDLLRDLLISERVGTVVEIGLAYSSSALAIGEALVSVGAPRPRHVVIDPLQATEWSNVGWRLLQSAGLDTIARLIRQPSSMALPMLIADEFTAEAAFVDGSHRFHEVFVDLYFLRKIVRPGGLIVLDDFWWPSVRTAARYFETNMRWEVVHDAFNGGTINQTTGWPRVQALRLPNPSFEPAFEHFQPFN